MMACYRPLKAFKVPGDVFDRDDVGNFVYDSNGLRKTHRGWIRAVRNNNVIGLHLMVNGKFQSLYEGDEPDIYDYTTFDYVPCRKCFGCRMDSQKMWTDRLMLELENHKDAWFVTLTYDDQHVHYSDKVSEDGEFFGDLLTLRKKDCQDFFKRLRKAFEQDPDVHLMYYLAGEYGGETKRPHYHAIIYGLPLSDLVLWKERSGFKYYSSPFLEEKWENGFVSVTKVTRTTAAYCCQYVMKKAFGSDAQVYIDRGQEPEFHLMSKRPAIAKQYYLDHVAGKQEDFYVNNIHFITGPDAEPISFSIPRYFDTLTEKENSDILVSVKEKRKRLGESRQKALEAQSSKRYEDILLDIEANKVASNINFRNSSKGGMKL